MRAILFMLIGVTLTACADQWSETKDLEVTQQIIENTRNCAAQSHSSVDVAICNNAIIIRTYSAANYPYMDLVQMMTNANYNVAADMDAHKITKEQAEQELTSVYDRVTSIEHQRLASADNRRAAVALLLFQASQNYQQTMQNYQRAMTPPPQINCTSSGTGQTVYTHCQ